MGNIVFNVSKGKVAAYVDRVINNDPTNAGLVLVMCKTVEADDVLNNHETLASILAGGNVECDFTNYTRFQFSEADLAAPVVDNTANTQTVAVTAKTITAAGGAVNNTILAAMLCYVPDLTAPSDATTIPLTSHAQTITTDGGVFNLNPGVFATSS